MELALDIVTSLIGVLVVGQYAWSTKTHFQASTRIAGAVFISFAVIATALFFLALTWLQSQPIAAEVSGIVIQLLSIALFWWAIDASRKVRLRHAFASENPHTLIQRGPYRYLRHPFYTSYVVFWIGWGIATWSVWAIIPVAGLTVMYAMAALDEEKKFAGSEMAGEYDLYRRATGFFWPRLL